MNQGNSHTSSIKSGSKHQQFVVTYSAYNIAAKAHTQEHIRGIIAFRGEHQVQTRKIYNRICGKTVDRVGQHQRINQSSWSLSTVSSIESVSLNGHIDRVGQSQRHHRSSWSVSTVSSIELVSLNGIIGRVGQHQRIFQEFNRTVARSTGRARRGTASRASRCFANKTSSAHLISLPSTPDSQPAMHTAYWLLTNHIKELYVRNLC